MSKAWRSFSMIGLSWCHYTGTWKVSVIAASWGGGGRTGLARAAAAASGVPSLCVSNKSHTAVRSGGDRACRRDRLRCLYLDEAQGMVSGGN
jgi:hypothetical protein